MECTTTVGLAKLDPPYVETGTHMATADLPRSMNEANERDPYNNNCYGTLVDRPYAEVKLPILDVHDFNERVIRGYEEGIGEKELPADLAVARSLIPAGTAATISSEFDVMRVDTARYAVSEREINQLGYFYISRGATARAVDVFALNVRAFPKSANVYDSLGEAQLALGDTAQAIANYRKSLELDPGNSNAVAILKRIAP